MLLQTVNAFLTDKEIQLFYAYFSVFLTNLKFEIENINNILQLDDEELKTFLIEHHKTLNASLSAIYSSLFEKNSFVELQKIKLSREFERIVENK